MISSDWSCDGATTMVGREAPGPDPRRSPRAVLNCPALLRQPGQCNYRVRLDDASQHGCRIEFVDRPRVGDRAWVKLDNLECLEAFVRWVEGFQAGVEFDSPIHPAVFDGLLATLGPSARAVD